MPAFGWGSTICFDREPPVAGQEAGPSIAGNGGVFPGLYDVLGRYFFFGLTANFL